MAGYSEHLKPKARQLTEQLVSNPFYGHATIFKTYIGDIRDREILYECLPVKNPCGKEKPEIQNDLG